MTLIVLPPPPPLRISYFVALLAMDNGFGYSRVACRMLRRRRANSRPCSYVYARSRPRAFAKPAAFFSANACANRNSSDGVAAERA